MKDETPKAPDDEFKRNCVIGCLSFWEITISKGKSVILNGEAILREPLLIKDFFVFRSGRVSKLSSKASVESRSVPSLKVSFFNLSFLFLLLKLCKENFKRSFCVF